MAYVDLLEDEVIPSRYLAVLCPKFRVTGFTLYSGSVYSMSFDLGTVIAVKNADTSLALGTSSSLNADQYFWDFELRTLYVRLSSGANPDTVFLVATYEICVANSEGVHWHRTPTDDTTRDVYFEPVIRRSPIQRQTVADSLTGSFPIQTSSIVLNNGEHWLEPHVHDSSFNRAEIRLYHWLGERLEVGNMKLVYRGLMSGVSYDGAVVTIKTFDRVDILSDEFRNPGVDNFFDSDTFVSLDPKAASYPIRQVYGRVDGHVPVNISYVEDAPTTSDNRTWVTQSGQDGLTEISRTVAVSPVSTTTRTYLNTTQGIDVGDCVRFDRVAGTDESKYVTTVDRTAHYIEHEAIVSAMASGDAVKRPFVSAITLLKDNAAYDLLYKTHYDVTTSLNGNASGFVLVNNFEATLTIGPLLPTDRLVCRVYGRTHDVTLSGGAFGAAGVVSGNLSQCLAVVVDLLKRCLAVTDAEINTASFTTALAQITDSVGLVIPDSVSGSFPKYRDLINKLMQTGLFRITVDTDLKWKVLAIDPVSASDRSIESDEILADSFSQDYEYSDISSEVTVSFNTREASTTPNELGNETSSVTATSDTAKYLHGVSHELTHDTLHFIEAEAQAVADRLSYIFGDRESRITLRARGRFLDAEIGQVLSVGRSALPGFEFDNDTTRSRNHVILEVSRTSNSIEIKATDQKGIQDNSASW